MWASPTGFISHWVGDGYYAKQKVFEAIEQVRADLITRLRSDANLRYCSFQPGEPEEKIDFHLNMSVAGVGLLRLLAQNQGCSLYTYRREAYNQVLVDRLLSKLGLRAEFERSDPRIQEVVRTGRMAV